MSMRAGPAPLIQREKGLYEGILAIRALSRIAISPKSGPASWISMILDQITKILSILA